MNEEEERESRYALHKGLIFCDILSLIFITVFSSEYIFDSGSKSLQTAYIVLCAIAILLFAVGIIVGFSKLNFPFPLVSIIFNTVSTIIIVAIALSIIKKSGNSDMFEPIWGIIVIPFSMGWFLFLLQVSIFGMEWSFPQKIISALAVAAGCVFCIYWIREYNLSYAVACGIFMLACICSFPYFGGIVAVLSSFGLGIAMLVIEISSYRWYLEEGTVTLDKTEIFTSFSLLSLTIALSAICIIVFLIILGINIKHWREEKKIKRFEEANKKLEESQKELRKTLDSLNELIDGDENSQSDDTHDEDELSKN